MGNGNGQLGPTWKWIAGALLSVIFAGGAASLGWLSSEITSLNRSKASKARVERLDARVKVNEKRTTEIMQSLGRIEGALGTREGRD